MSVGRKQPLNHGSEVQPRSVVKSREVTKQNNHYLAPQIPLIYHSPKTHKYQEKHFLDPPKQSFINLRLVTLRI